MTSDIEIKGQETTFDINSLHRKISTVLHSMMKHNAITVTYDPDLLQTILDGFICHFLDSQTKGFENKAHLEQEGWNFDKAMNAERMSDLAFEHIKKHVASKMKSAWHQLIIEAIFHSHPDFIRDLEDDEKMAKRYERAVSFFDKENKSIEDERRNEAGFTFASKGSKPKSPENWEKDKNDLEKRLKLIASSLNKKDITWDFLAEKVSYSSGDSLRKAVRLKISELKALGK